MGIKMKEQFPASRRADPKRLAEARVFDALTNLEGNGHGLYEFRYRDDGQQVDFALWLHGKGRFAIEVKGGRYEMPSAGEWQLVRPDGERTTVPSPVEEAADGAIEMRSAIIEATGYKNFIAAVLLFPDMERDKRIESAARRTSCVHTVWGLDGLDESLERVAELAEFRRPPLSRISENEWELLYELQYARPPAPDSQRQEPAISEGHGLDARQVIIQHVEHLHIHTPALTGAEDGNG